MLPYIWCNPRSTRQQLLPAAFANLGGTDSAAAEVPKRVYSRRYRWHVEAHRGHSGYG